MNMNIEIERIRVISYQCWYEIDGNWYSRKIDLESCAAVNLLLGIVKTYPGYKYNFEIYSPLGEYDIEDMISHVTDDIVSYVDI